MVQISENQKLPRRGSIVVYMSDSVLEPTAVSGTITHSADMTASTTTQSNSYPHKAQPFSPLLSLPAELRLQIYAHLLSIPADDLALLRRLTSRNHLSSYVLPTLDLYPEILRVSRQTYTEAHAILYASNTYCAHACRLTSTPYLLASSKPVLSPRCIRLIKKWHIQVRLDCDPNYNKQQATEAFTGAEELELEIWQAMFGAAGEGVLKLFAGVRAVGKAKVTGSVTPGVKRWLEYTMRKPVEWVSRGDEGELWEGTGLSHVNDWGR